MNKPTLLMARHPELGSAFAAVDPLVHFVDPAVRSSRIGARLAPYSSEEAARAALEAAGCDPATIEPHRA